jgi:hypothetical protein
MVKQDNKLLALLGFNCTGDVGPWTLYTSKRGALVFYPRVPALSPPSAQQFSQRQRFSQAASLWRMMPQSARDNWELATKRASLKLTGYNLFTFWYTRRDLDIIRTIERQTSLQLLT